MRRAKLKFCVYVRTASLSVCENASQLAAHSRSGGPLLAKAMTVCMAYITWCMSDEAMLFTTKSSCSAAYKSVSPSKKSGILACTYAAVAKTSDAFRDTRKPTLEVAWFHRDCPLIQAASLQAAHESRSPALLPAPSAKRLPLPLPSCACLVCFWFRLSNSRYFQFRGTKLKTVSSLQRPCRKCCREALLWFCKVTFVFPV